MQIHTFSAGTVERKGNILKIVYSKEESITLQDMQEITAIRKELFGENKYCSLIDLTKDLLVLTPEAKKFASTNPNIKQLRIAEVLLVKNFAQKLGVQTYVKLFRSKDRIKVMTEEEHAANWLEKEYKRYFELQLKKSGKHA